MAVALVAGIPDMVVWTCGDRMLGRKEARSQLEYLLMYK